MAALALPAWGAVSGLSSADARKAGLLQAELDRDASAKAVLAGLDSPDAALRERAALSLARIGGPSAALHFSRWVGDGEQPLTPAIVGAVAVLAPPTGVPGEPPEPAGVWSDLERGLWSRYAVAEDPALADALLLAIARLGGRVSIRNLAVDLAALPSGAEAVRFEHGAQALAILCVRGHALSGDALDALGQALTAQTVPPRRGAAYALSRCAGPSAERLAGAVRGVLVERLSAIVSAAAPDESESLAAWRALEALGEPPASIPATVLGPQPPPWQVEVAAVRALGASAGGRGELAERLGRISPWDFDAPRVHVLLEALRGLRRAAEGTPELLEPFTDLGARIAGGLAGITDPRKKKALALVHCEMTALQSVRSGDVSAVRTCARGVPGLPAHYGEVLAIDALLAMGDALPKLERVDALLTATGHVHPAVAAAAVAALADVDDPRVNVALRNAMQSDDVGLASAAAGAIASRAVDKEKRDAAAPAVLVAALARLTNDRAVEARVEAIGALGSLARSARPDPKPGETTTTTVPWLDDLVALAADPNQAIRATARSALTGWPEALRRFESAVPTTFEGGFSPTVHAALDSGGGATGLVLHTAAGDMTVSFEGAPAPIAQANMAALATNGYFDGLTFHRIVPAFVVQGGDPRGDGYGGPGHVMPCEWSNVRYERGTVGIALAGKDTGGSQLFIAHGSPHHLDARYPVIGRVTDGLEVVDALLPHDTINAIDVVDH